MSIFNTIPIKVPKKNKFNLSHQTKLTCDMGKLIPIMCEPVIPGDRFKISSQQLIRFAPMVAPIMSDVDVYTHFYFVPSRLIWDNWETFITGAKNGKKISQENLPSYPRISINPNLFNKKLRDIFDDSEIDPDDEPRWVSEPIMGVGSLPDYLDFQTVNKSYNYDGSGAESMIIDELPFRAYQKVYFDYYRDENLSPFDDFSQISSRDGILELKRNDNNSILYINQIFALRNRSWKKDYLTSALPFPQKGDSVELPLAGFNIPVNGDSEYINLESYGSSNFTAGGSNNQNITNHQVMAFGDAGKNGIDISTFNDQNQQVAIKLNTNNFGIDAVNIAKQLNEFGLGPTTINELRRAYAAQRFLERRAVGGSRYIEQNLAFFGVKSSDARLQRAEFLGGSKQPVVISQVLQTSQTTEGENGSPQGNPAGNAISVGGKYLFDKFFEEYGYIIGVMSIMPRADYIQGIPRKYLKFDPYEYYWPQFAKIGEQPIFNQEVKWTAQTDGYDLPNNGTFGYTPRYAEYRYIPNRVHGDFKDSLLHWTLARNFNQPGSPLLNESFIECVPSQRVFAYRGDDFNKCWVQVNLNISALRPITKYGEAL